LLDELATCSFVARFTLSARSWASMS